MAAKRARPALGAEQRADAALTPGKLSLQFTEHGTMVSLSAYELIWETYLALQEKYDALVKEVIAMKRDGFVPSVPMDAPKPIPDLPAPITETLRDLALEPMTERQLRKQAWERLRQGMEPIDVAKLIEAGETVDL